MANHSVVLHLGAHKTATTYLQRLFFKNRQLLESDLSFGYVPMFRLRADVTTRLDRADSQPERSQMVEALRSYGIGVASDGRSVLLSDENLIGDCAEIMRSGKLYPRMLTRLRRLRELLGEEPREIWFAVRAYDHFLASAYVEANRHAKEFLSWDATAARVNLSRRRWPQVLADIQTVFPGARIRVWAFEQFVADDRSVIVQLIGEGAARLEFIKEAVRASSSADAMRVAELLSEKLGPAAAASVFAELDAMLPKSATRLGFSPWSDDEKAAFRRLYEADLQQLGQADGVELISVAAQVGAPRSTTAI